MLCGYLYNYRRNSKKQIHVEWRAKNIIRERLQTPTRREYAKREKRISTTINDR